MNRLTNEQRLQIIEFYYQNDCSVRKVHRALLPFYGQFNRPTEAAIRALVIKFRTKFTLLDIKPPTRLRRARTEENIAAVSESVNDDHQLSIRRRSKQLGLCYSTTLKILRKDLNVKPFKTHEEEQQVEGTVASVDDAEPEANEYDNDNKDDDAEENQEKELEEEEEQQIKKQIKNQQEKRAEKQLHKEAEKPKKQANPQAENQAKKKVQIQAKNQTEKPAETQTKKQAKKKAEKQLEELAPKRRRGRASKK